LNGAHNSDDMLTPCLLELFFVRYLLGILFHLRLLAKAKTWDIEGLVGYKSNWRLNFGEHR